jgi:hypothetical protein
MSLKLNDPIYVAHSGFYLNRRGEVDPLALATVGFLRSLDTTTAKFCLYLLLRTVNPRCQVFKQVKPLIEVRKRIGPTINVNCSKKPNIEVLNALSPRIEVRRTKNPEISVFLDECGAELD